MLGAQVDARMRDGRTALFLAAANGKLETADLLIALGADIHAQYYIMEGRSFGPLIAAGLNNHGTMVAMLQQRGAVMSEREADTAIKFKEAVKVRST